jgi:lipopolysaccharide/colanic/teichoic acid biosynthesis glycosyltransferase
MLYTLTKRVIDFTGALFLSLIFLPIWIIVPILIKLDSPGPVFYMQKRVGQNGKPFRILKFRTMITNADEYWKAHPDIYEKFKKSSWKLTLDEDPRITRLGRVLRQTSIDEFPQVFNILFGTMSLIGPRPVRDIEISDAIDRYGEGIKKDIDKALSAKPGLSGPWQVSGRNDIPWDKRLAMDAQYAQKKSIVFDVMVMLRTPLAMISKW